MSRRRGLVKGTDFYDLIDPTWKEYYATFPSADPMRQLRKLPSASEVGYDPYSQLPDHQGLTGILELLQSMGKFQRSPDLIDKTPKQRTPSPEFQNYEFPEGGTPGSFEFAANPTTAPPKVMRPTPARSPFGTATPSTRRRKAQQGYWYTDDMTGVKMFSQHGTDPDSEIQYWKKQPASGPAALAIQRRVNELRQM